MTMPRCREHHAHRLSRIADRQSRQMNGTLPRDFCAALERSRCKPVFFPAKREKRVCRCSSRGTRYDDATRSSHMARCCASPVRHERTLRIAERRRPSRPSIDVNRERVRSSCRIRRTRVFVLARNAPRPSNTCTSETPMTASGRRQHHAAARRSEQADQCSSFSISSS